MTPAVSPIAQTVQRLREALPDCLETLHADAQPDTPLEGLFPVAERRRAWRQLRRHGLPLPELQLPGEVSWRNLLRGLRVTVSLALSLWWWPALLLAIPLGGVCYWVSRPWAVEFPLGLRTVGELAVLMTPFCGEQGRGHGWTDEEVGLKVRMVIAGSLGLALADVRPERSLVDLAGC